MAKVFIFLLVAGAAAAEKHHFPDFVAIEQNEVPICGGWVVDKPFRRHVLTTEHCAGGVREKELLVRHGSAKVTWRTLSSGVDRILRHPAAAKLVVLSTFGTFRKREPTTTAEELQQLPNATTVVLSWRWNYGVLEKSAIVLEDDREYTPEELTGHLLCSDHRKDAFILEGGLLLRNQLPYAMMMVVPEVESDCGAKLLLVELPDLSQSWSFASLRGNSSKRDQGDDESSGSFFTEANSPFGYIMLMIFLGYNLLYTMFYFIFCIDKLNPSTSL
uniref:Peptidase S1 domain-containing protein n=1 Tax=Anopheles albimanus TaxID=7167 RepID=A0A182FBH2_ANOAL